ESGPASGSVRHDFATNDVLPSAVPVTTTLPITLGSRPKSFQAAIPPTTPRNTKALAADATRSRMLMNTPERYYSWHRSGAAGRSSGLHRTHLKPFWLVMTEGD